MKPKLRESAPVWRQSIKESGFAIVRGVFSQRDITVLLDCITQSSLLRSRAGIRHALRHPAVTAIASDSRLLEIVHATLGRQALPFRATLFDKSPSANWLVAWHQDTALPLSGGRRDISGWGPWAVKEGVTYAHAPATALCKVLALRVHRDDSTAENAPLRVLAGTHTLGVLTD